MSKILRLHPMFQQFTGNERVEVNGHTIRECLAELIERFPQIKARLYSKDGNLAPYIDLYLNSVNVGTTNLDQALNDGDELTIIVILAGG